MKKKRTTLRKQFSRSIMLVIVAVFAVSTFLLSLQSLKLISTIADFAISAVGNGAKGSIAQFDFSKVETEGSLESNEFKEIQKSLNEYSEEIGTFISDLAIVYKADEQYYYFLGYHGREKVAPDTKYTNVDVEMEKVFTSGQEYNTKITPSLVWNRQPIKMYVPIDSERGTDAVIYAEIQTNAVFRVFMTLIGLVVLVMGIILAIIRISVGIVAKRETESIEQLRDKMKEIANLDGDLTKRIQIKSNNEIGELAEYTNQLLDTIQDFMKNTRESTVYLSDTSSEFMAVSEETAASAATLDTTIATMTEFSQSQAGIASEVSRHMEEMNEAVSQVANNAQDVSTEATHTNESAVEGKEAMEDMKNYVEIAVEQVENTGEHVIKLNDLSQQINLIVDAITNIANQTNLLALNASIEAARAGENGRGFAVVAEEVRKLAEESAKQAEDITILIHEVQQSIEGADTSMNKAISTLEEERIMVDNVSTRFASIVDSIHKVSQRVEEVSSAAQEMAAGTTVVTTEVEELSTITEENCKASGEVANSISQQNEKVQQMAKDMAKIDNIAFDLREKLVNVKLD